MKREFACVILMLVMSPAAFSHFPILIHDAPFAEVNQAVKFMFAVGHPYEQEYTDPPKPEKVTAFGPNGQSTDLTASLTAGQYTVDTLTAKVWEFTYKPEAPGDCIVALNTAPEIGLNNMLNQEFLKVCLHVEEQGGWDTRTGQPLEIVPLTRPYGLEEGYVFTGQLLKGNEPLAGVSVEIEQFMTQVPAAEDLPPEPLITKVVKTDPNGVFTYTLPHPGWWIIAAYVENAGEIQKDGRTYTLSGLAALWIHVEKTFEQKFTSRIYIWQKHN
mgnify:CR=1 FL=1